MRRLVEDFDRVFDLDYRIHGTRLGDLVTGTLSRLDEHPLPDWGTAGKAEQTVSASGRFVSFYYRPHLFPGMDLKLRLAHKLQFHLLPRELPPRAPVDVAAVLESYCHLSGDLFGWEMLRDGRFLLWIVDMAGHGVRSGLASAVLKVLVDHLPERSRVASLVAELDRALGGCLRPGNEGVFATGFFVSVGADGSAAYASAAHPPVLVRRADGTLEELASLSRPIGLLPGDPFESRELRLGPGDALLLYTDGLIETTGRDGRVFGLDRLRRLFRADFDVPENLTGSVYREIAERQDMARLDDDVTFLAARMR